MNENLKERTPEELLCEEVVRDFERRRAARRALERGWELNMNFVNGNQYCGISGAGDIVTFDKTYDWEQRRVFNHVAPIVDTRVSKLSRIRPKLAVRAASEDESDRHSAALAEAILASVQEDRDLDGVISTATVWSEICGTAFYKTVWNSRSGRVLGLTEEGAKLREGGVEIAAVSPFEIYPDSLSTESLEEQSSIIHAKAVSVQAVLEMYGVQLVGGEELSLLGYSPYSAVESPCDMVLVLERYERPTSEWPNGRLTVVAGGKLLFNGDLPYKNGEDGARGYPFVKQVSVAVAGSFFGASVVERLIPLQRAYNAVKNRKHEFLNRISMGTVAVEDGSVDVDELADDGLAPGKVIVYRQGGTPPEMLTLGSVPNEFWKEEENLLSEFVKISGTGDLSDNATSFAGITSATGLQLLIEQDDARLNVAYQSLKRAIKCVGRQILRLYRQFASDTRLLRYAGGNNALNLFYFKGSDISSDDVVLEADSDLNMTPAQRRTIVYELMDRGLFSDGDGKLSMTAKNRILELLGFPSLSGGRDLGELNRARAGVENLKLLEGDVPVKEYDDHATHITEHTAFLLTEEPSAEAEGRIVEHIEEHKVKLSGGNFGEN